MPPRDRINLRRVALVIGQLELGGTEKQVSLLARGLHGRGIEAHVILLSRGGPHEATLRDMGIAVHHLGFTRRSSGSSALVQNMRAFARLVGLLRRIKPDVLHAFLLESYVLGAPAARLARVPLVVAGRRSLSHFSQERRWIFALGKAVTRVTDHVVANAAAVAEDVRAVERLPADKLSVIYNGLPVSAFEPVEPESIDTKLPVVLCVARLRPEKGHRFLIGAAALLSQRGRPCTLVFVGDGPEWDRLKEQANGLDLDIRFMGARTDVEGFLARADIVVLPSVSEGLSNAVMEAMAMGRPIVATAVGGTPELLEDRGILVPASDPATLAEAFVRLFDDPELAASLGTAARAWARKNLDVTVMVDEHIKLYHRLMGASCVE